MQMIGSSKIISMETLQGTDLNRECTGLLSDFIQTYRIRKTGLNTKKVWKIVLNKSYDIDEGEFLSLKSGNRGLTISNTWIANHRARTLLLKTSGAVIENNTVFHSMNASIVMSPERFWTEGGYSRDMQIRGNKFIDCGYGVPNPGTSQPAMISIIGMGDKGVFAEADNHKNILIENNYFELCFSMPMVITSADNVKILNNVFKYTHFRESNQGIRNGVDQERIAWIKNSKNIIYKGNKILYPGKYLAQNPVYTDNVEGLDVNLNP